MEVNQFSVKELEGTYSNLKMEGNTEHSAILVSKLHMIKY